MKGTSMQADEKKIELFERLSIPRATLKLCVPTVLSSLVMVLYNLADTYFVGMLNDPIQNAAVTLAAPVLLAFNAVNNLFGVGTSSMMSRSLGARDYDAVRKASAFGFWCSLLGGLLISFICGVFNGPLLDLLGTAEDTRSATMDYLLWTTVCGAAPAILNVVMAYLVRSEGASLHASIGTMSGCVLNMILDPFFILPFGLNMGAAGAGLATMISNCFACVYFFVLLWKKRGHTYVCIDPRKAKAGKRIILGIFGVGIPASIQNLLNVTGMTILNNFAAAAGADAVAAMGIAQKINVIPSQIALGMSQGIMPLVSYNYACLNAKRMKSAVFFTGGIGTAFTLVMLAVYYIFADKLIALFMNNAVIIAYGTPFLRAMCFAIPLVVLDFIAVGVFQACGMGSKALLFAILRKIVLEIPLLFILNTVYPLYGLAWAQPITELVLAIAAVLMVLGIFRKVDAQAAKRKEQSPC